MQHNTQNMYLSGEYLKNNPTWGIEDSNWKAKQIIKLLQKNNISLKSACEVGCGAGEILNELQKNMPTEISFYGYEISPHAINLCKLKENPKLKFFLKDLCNEQDMFFDLLLIIDVFEHVEDYFTFLRKLKNKASYKIFHIPLDISVLSVIRGDLLVKGRYSVGHINSFTKETAIATLTDTGYEIIDFFYTSGATDLPSRKLRTKLANIPRRILFKINKDLTARLFGGYSLMVLTK